MTSTHSAPAAHRAPAGKATGPDVSPQVAKAATLAYKPFGLLFSVLGGVVANLAFGQIWKRLSDAPTPPDATDEGHSTREVLLAAGLQGALYGVIKSAVDRAGMHGVRRVLHGGGNRA